MMEQKGSILGSLYYNDAAPEHVGIPVAEIKALGAQKEKEYVIGQENLNALHNLKKSLPTDISPDLANKLTTKIEAEIGKITPDNYSSSYLDVAQLANDVKTKFGGDELLTQQAQKGAATEAMKVAVDKGVLDKERQASYEEDQAKQYKPITEDEKGNIIKSDIKPVPIIPYVSGQKVALDLGNKWLSDKTIDRNPDGTFKVVKDFPGLLGTVDHEKVTAPELRNALRIGLRQDKGYNEYSDDRAERLARNTTQAANKLFNDISQENKDKIFGTNATVDDIKYALDTGKFNARDYFKQSEEDANIAVAVEKYSFDKADLKLQKNELELKALETAQANANAAAKANSTPAEIDTSVVKVEQALNSSIANPADVIKIKEYKQKLVGDRQQAQIEYNQYKKAIESAGSKDDKSNGKTIDNLTQLDKRLKVLDQQIEKQVEYEKAINKITLDTFDKNQTPINSLYNSNVADITKSVINHNRNEINNKPFNLDISSIVKKDKNNKEYYINPDTNVPIYLDKQPYKISKAGGRTYITNGDSTGTIDSNSDVFPNKLLFNKDGTISDRVSLNTSYDKSRLHKVPTQEEYTNLITDMYVKDPSHLLSNTYSSDEVKEQYTPIINKGTMNAIDEVRKNKGDFHGEVTTPLSAITVYNVGKKESLAVFKANEEATTKEFLKSHDLNYVVNSPSGSTTITRYLKDKYNIDGVRSEEIDWDKTITQTAIQSDRDYGQQLIVSIPITKKGLEAHSDDPSFKGGFLKFAVVNTSPGKEGREFAVQATVETAFKDIKDDVSPNGQERAKQLGAVWLNNSPIGKTIDDLHLYVMPAGSMPIFNIPNGDKQQQYQISTNARSAISSDINNVDFNLQTFVDGSLKTYATDKQGNTSLVDISNVKTLQNPDAEYTRVVFPNPESIKGFIGAGLLKKKVQENTNTNSSNNTNVYADALRKYNAQTKTTTMQSKQGTKDVITDNYTNDANTSKRLTKDVQHIAEIVNINGVKTKLKIRVDANDLVDVTSDYKDRFSKGMVSYGQINKAIEPSFRQLMTDFPNIKLNGLFRANNIDGSETVKGSVEDSAHKYGTGIDLAIDENSKALAKELENNPEFAKKYNIIRILEHSTSKGKPDHVHIEFKVK